MAKGKLVLLFGLMAVLLVQGQGWGAVVKLKNGRDLRGEVLLETKDRVIVRLVTMGTVELKRSEVKEIIYTKEELTKRNKDEYKQKLGDLAVSDPDKRYALALWCLEKDLLEEARDQLEKAVELKDEFFEAHVKLGDVQMRLGQYTGAVESWEKARSLKPDDKAVKKDLVKAYEEVGRTLLSEKKFPEALRLLKKLEKELPVSKKIAASIRKAESALKQAEEHLWVGERHFRKQEYAKALEGYGKALELNGELLDRMKPRLDTCNLSLGNSCYARQDFRGAITFFEGYVKVRPELGEVIEKLSDAYVELGLQAYRDNDFREAARAFRLAVALRPSDPATHLYLGMVYSAQGKYKEALAEATEAVQRSSVQAQAEELQANMNFKLAEAKGSDLVGSPRPPQVKDPRPPGGRDPRWPEGEDPRSPGKVRSPERR